MWSTTTLVRTGTTLYSSPQNILPTVIPPIGAKPSTLTASMLVQYVSSFSPTPDIGSTSFTSMVYASTRRRTSTTPHPTTSWQRSPAGCGTQLVDVRPSWWRRTNRSIPNWYDRQPRVVTASMPYGTMTFTIAQWSR